jgi:hypothetical protein
MDQPQLTELVEAWKTIKDDIKRREKEFEDSLAEDKLARDLLEQDILDGFRVAKINSMVIKGLGTPYISKRATSKVEDAEAFFSFVFQTGMTELLHTRASDKAVEAFIEERKAPPPGVTVQIAERLNFRAKQ